MILGDGWYSGYIGWRKERGHYGLRNSLLARLEMEYEDGAKTAVVTDETWKCAEGPILSSDIMMGEIYDARKEMPGWNAPGFDDSRLEAARTVVEPPAAALVAQPSEPVQAAEEVQGGVGHRAETGRVCFRPRPEHRRMGAAQGHRSRRNESHAPLRRAAQSRRHDLHHQPARARKPPTPTSSRAAAKKSTSRISPSTASSMWKLTGLPSKPDLDAVTGCVAYSTSPVAGSFECSSPMVNKLYSNICWGQRGNFISIPTDCPQRDERLGWMGDAQIFIRTATYNRDVAAFFTKWMHGCGRRPVPGGRFRRYLAAPEGQSQFRGGRRPGRTPESSSPGPSGACTATPASSSGTGPPWKSG